MTEEIFSGPSDSNRLTMRDRFAISALQGILAGGFANTVPHDDPIGAFDAAQFAYQYADAMLLARRS